MTFAGQRQTKRRGAGCPRRPLNPYLPLLFLFRYAEPAVLGLGSS